MAHGIPSVGHFLHHFFAQSEREGTMSVSDFEEKILTYVWRAVVLAGLATVLGSTFFPAPSPQVQRSQVQGQMRSAPNTDQTR